MKISLIAFALVSCACDAGTIYMCGRPNGDTFWAAAQCSQHNAGVQRTVTTPDGLSFEQQVRFAEEPLIQAECKALDSRITELDATARQPLSAQAQDQIRVERRQARDRQFALRCR